MSVVPFEQRQATPLADMTLYDVELAGSVRSEIPSVAGVLVAAPTPTTEDCVLAAVLSTVQDPTSVLEAPTSSIRPIYVVEVEHSSRRKATATTTATTSEEEEPSFSDAMARNIVMCGLVVCMLIMAQAFVAAFVAVLSVFAGSSGETDNNYYDTYPPSGFGTQAPKPILPMPTTDVFPYNWRIELTGSPMSSVAAGISEISLVDGYSVETLEECQTYCQDYEMLSFFEDTTFRQDNCICHDSSSVSCLMLSGYDQGFVLSKVPPPNMCE
jgi:hypothetical protein